MIEEGLGHLKQLSRAYDYRRLIGRYPCVYPSLPVLVPIFSNTGVAVWCLPLRTRGHTASSHQCDYEELLLEKNP